MVRCTFLCGFPVLVAAGHPFALLLGFVAAVLAAIHYTVAVTGVTLLLLLFAPLLDMLRMFGVRVGGGAGLCNGRRGDDERQGAENDFQHFISPDV